MSTLTSAISSVTNFLQPAAPILQVGGTILSAYQQRQAGNEAAKASFQAAANDRAMAEFEALQQERYAGEARQEAELQAAEQQRSARRLASNALAAAAASGAGARDPSVVNIMAEIVGEGNYRAQVALYEGEKEARNRLLAATARRMGAESSAAARIGEGRAQSKAGSLAATSTIIRGVGSWAERYGVPQDTPTAVSGDAFAEWGLYGSGAW